MPGNISVIVVGSGIGELVRTPEMAWGSHFLGRALREQGH
jgi:hypothetical protein